MESKSSLTDFLQVNINMQKFNLFASTLSSALASHDKTLQQHSRQLAQLRLTMQDRTTRLKSQLEYQKDRFDKKRKQDNIYFNGVMTDTLKKYDDLMNQSNLRLNHLELTLSHKKDQEEIKQNIKEQIKNVWTDQIKLVQEQMSMMENHIKVLQSQLKKSIGTQDFILKNVIEAIDHTKLKNQNVSQTKPQERQMMPTKKVNQKVKHHHHHHHTATTPLATATPQNNINEKSFNLDQVTHRQAQQRRKKKAQQKCQQQNLQYASISAKIDQLEHRLTVKQNQSLNKVIYASLNGNRVASESSQQGIPMSMDRIQLERKNLQSNITQKLEHIEEIIQQKLTDCDRQTDRLKNKIDILADQVDIALRKFQKQRNKAVDISMQLKKIQEKKFDDRLADNLTFMVRRNIQNIEEQLEQKLQKQLWEKDSIKLNQKIKLFSQELSNKADKDQIRRAFQFIEDKIKQIVMLMADDAQNQKQGAGRRLPFKCLSCDKDLENSMPSTQRNHTSNGHRLANRTSSSNLRKRVRGQGCIESAL